MRPGSNAQEELFCRSFIQAHVRYEPENLPRPELSEKDLVMLRALPVWDTLWQAERKPRTGDRYVAAWISGTT
jgi:hypothetical protein